MRGYSSLSYESIETYGLFHLLSDISMAVLYENLAEYYWHRLLHSIPLLYKHFHKIHHFYKSPEPFDDMYIHPLEATIYYCILYSPPFLFQIHLYAFVIYMVIMGLCGVLDHSGIPFSIPLLYDTKAHHFHHLKFDVNYGFPFAYLDLLHGTFYEEGIQSSADTGLKMAKSLRSVDEKYIQCPAKNRSHYN